MKTPDEIKKALEICSNGGLWDCDACPYGDSDDCWECRSDLYEDAAAYIHQLENQLADAGKKVDQLEAAQPKWISVEERLPEKHGQLCVCLFNQYGADKSILFPLVFTWYAYGHNGYINGPHFSDEGLDGLKVHYWMPLPQPPKE